MARLRSNPFWFGVPAIVVLSCGLALGFLLTVLSCALFNNWLPILVALTFVLAPLPNALVSWCAGAEDFTTDNNAALDFGYFVTAITVVTGFALPLVLSNANIIHPAACWMSMTGGVLVYGTIIMFGHFFSSTDELS